MDLFGILRTNELDEGKIKAGSSFNWARSKDSVSQKRWKSITAASTTACRQHISNSMAAL